MSKKKKEDDINKETVNTEENKESIVKPTVSKSKKEDAKKGTVELKTLKELVDDCGLSRFLLFTCLSEKGYLNQYYTEGELLEKGVVVQPTISEEDFEKIIEEYKE